MKPFRSMQALAACSAVTLLAACASDPAPTASQPAATPVASTARPAAPATPRTSGAPTGNVNARPEAQRAVDPFSDPSNVLSKRSVFYDYDEYTVKAEYRPVIEAHAKYLKANPNARVGIEGNADERGSREYNLALGQKRAEAVKSLFVVLGVPERQLETTSNGEEKPQGMGHDESAWAKNRRSDLVYSRR
jgi:peptidoglycan-associated lipoprotein